MRVLGTIWNERLTKKQLRKWLTAADKVLNVAEKNAKLGNANLQGKRVNNQKLL